MDCSDVIFGHRHLYPAAELCPLLGREVAGYEGGDRQCRQMRGTHRTAEGFSGALESLRKERSHVPATSPKGRHAILA